MNADEDRRAFRLTPAPTPEERELAAAIDEFAEAAKKSPEVDAAVCRRLIAAALRMGDDDLADAGEINGVAGTVLGLPMGYLDRLAAELLLAGISPWGLTVAQAAWILAQLNRPSGVDAGTLDIMKYRIDDDGSDEN